MGTLEILSCLYIINTQINYKAIQGYYEQKILWGIIEGEMHEKDYDGSLFCKHHFCRCFL